jgi:hypothetical protein
MLDDDIWVTRAPMGVVITPVEQQKLALSTLAILLNELDSMSDRDGRIRSVPKHISVDHLMFHLHMLFQCEDAALARWLAFQVFPGNWSIDVEASREWIVIEWEPLKTTRKSTEATQHRARERRVNCYTANINGRSRRQRMPRDVWNLGSMQLSILYGSRQTNSPSGFRYCHDGHMAEVSWTLSKSAAKLLKGCRYA